MPPERVRIRKMNWPTLVSSVAFEPPKDTIPSALSLQAPLLRVERGIDSLSDTLRSNGVMGHGFPAISKRMRIWFSVRAPRMSLPNEAASSGLARKALALSFLPYVGPASP